MARMAALLRGVNLGRNRKIPMADLRRVLSEGGFPGVGTYLQSGNVLFESDEPPASCGRRMEELIAQGFGHDVPVLVRDRAELERIVEANPLGAVAVNPSRYLVVFLSQAPQPDRIAALNPAEFHPDVFTAGEREIYVWCPNGVSESKLTASFLERRLGVMPTARNWNTVEALLAKL